MIPRCMGFHRTGKGTATLIHGFCYPGWFLSLLSGSATRTLCFVVLMARPHDARLAHAAPRFQPCISLTHIRPGPRPDS
jgi:hypothetical protein